MVDGGVGRKRREGPGRGGKEVMEEVGGGMTWLVEEEDDGGVDCDSDIVAV